MFKDIYKQANDRIDTQSAKSRVIAKLNKPVPVRKAYSGAKIAALAACFVLTIAVAGIYEQVQKDAPPVPVPPVAVTEEAMDDISQNSQIATVSETESLPVPQKAAEPPAKAEGSPKTIKKAQDLEKSKPESDTTEQKKVRSVPVYPTNSMNTESAKSEEGAFVEKSTTESSATETPVDVSLETAEIFADESADMPRKASGGGSSARNQSDLAINEATVARAAFVIPEGTQKEVSVAEYCEYLGKNIPEAVSAAVDMTDETIGVQTLEVDEAGEYTDDNYEFLFTQEDKVLKIETTKKTDTIKEKIENPDLEKSKIGEREAVVTAENDVMKAYFATDEIGYTITSVNCEKSELEAVILNLN